MGRAEALCAILSVFVNEKVKNDKVPDDMIEILGKKVINNNKYTKNIPEELKEAFAKLKESAKLLGEIKKESKINIDPDEYANEFNPDLCHVILFWSEGKNFGEI